ncbi:tyrosine-type recombinase/integrase [Streptomyces flaveus]|uniref:tyrosine-type recombinase/integrase n=1 Tax=Streptomyces flaveus TaxID=66370 RepID=UPI00331D9692
MTTVQMSLRTRLGPAEAGPQLSSLLKRFPARPVASEWEATGRSADEVLHRLVTPPFVVDSPSNQADRHAGMVKILRWLETYPGDTWQQRWLASGADPIGNTAWRHLASRTLAGREGAGRAPQAEFIRLGRGMLPLLAGDVIRPSLSWLVTPGGIPHLISEMARSRDPAAFSQLTVLSAQDPANTSTKEAALRRITAVLAAKGGTVSDITVGDCLQFVEVLADERGRRDTSLYFYQLLHALGVFPPDAPPTVRIFAVPGQQSIEQLVDRYDFACRPIRDLMISYLRERQPALDYTSLRNLSFGLGKMFWKDLEIHHPGISSLRLPTEVAAAWKQRIALKETTVTDSSGRRARVQTSRSDAGINYLAMIRAFYLDIAQWAMEDPALWGPWAAPCPIRVEEMSRRKDRLHRKSRIDQRTRERLPVLPVLVTTVTQARQTAAERLELAQRTEPGELFTVEGITLRRPVLAKPSAKTWAEDPDTGKREDLTLTEHRAFWTWAAVEVLRHTGIRVEELTELSHHSFVQYRLPTTGELVPLLQIAPSKSDAERLLVISPELADVLSAIVCRVRDDAGAVPLVVSYDGHERVWNPPMPLLFQRRYGVENRPINAEAIRALLNKALAGTGLTDAEGRPLHFVPHDFRRLFITDAILNGMPPHIAQLVCGHKDINTTMGYKAVYPEEVINGHRAFIARRRAIRPSEEYRTPTDEEWEEFLGHFERRKVAHGTCGRAFGSACIHEHACLRCALLRPDPAQHERLLEVRDNLLARIAEAQREGWLAEVEGLRVSLAGAEQKLAQTEQIATQRTTVHLGIPDFSQVVGRDATDS